MGADPSTKAKRLLTWLVVGLAAFMLGLGTFLHGFSVDVHHRFWSDIFGRLDGPMSFRFILQPLTAFLAALPDGIDDAKHGHSAFFWTDRSDTSLKRGRLRQGLTSVARVILLGITIDIIYQLKVFDEFYPAEAVAMAILLAIIPYFIFRWIVERIVRWQIGRQAPDPNNRGGAK